MENIREWIIDWFVENGTTEKEVLCENLNSNYFNAGFIDSFVFISLIGDIEEEYDIEFDNEQFLDRDFATINGLAEIIAELVG
ncbi:MAG: acyl carrier protein [Lachnospiraceae bacterium]|nr:acyl carrier protein [Lachnospiraceae bacterium]